MFISLKMVEVEENNIKMAEVRYLLLKGDVSPAETPIFSARKK